MHWLVVESVVSELTMGPGFKSRVYVIDYNTVQCCIAGDNCTEAWRTFPATAELLVNDF